MSVLDLPFVAATRLADQVGAVSGRAIRQVADIVTGARDGLGDGVARVEDLVDDVGVEVGEFVEEVGDFFDDVGDLVDDVGEFVEDVGEIAVDVIEEGQDLIEDAFGRHRRVWEGEGGHVQIELRGLHLVDQVAGRRRLKREVEALRSVRWAEVNAITRRVAVAFDPEVLPIPQLIGVVEAVENAVGATRRRQDPLGWDVRDRADHPADVEPIHRSIAIVAGTSLALGAAVVGRLTRAPRLPVEVAALTSVVEHLPPVRQRLESLLGRRAVDLLLPMLSASVNGIAQGPVGIAVDLVHQVSVLTELQARHRVWNRREPSLYADHHGIGPGSPDVEPPVIGSRPGPLRDGPVETWAARSSYGALAVGGSMFIGGAGLRRSADAMLAAIPKAARLGREGFATQLGRTLASRGVVALDGSALRRLDRIDVVVLDSATLLSGRLRVAEVVGLQGASDDEIRRAVTMADRLVDALEARADEGERSTPSALDAVRDLTLRRGDWTIGPLDRAETLPRGAKARAAELRRNGATAMLLAWRGRPVALAGVADRLDPGADELVAAVREAGLGLVVAGRNGGLDRSIDHDGVIPAGRAMGAAVRDLQRSGAGVAVVVRRGTNGLAAADVGINVARPSGRPSWGGDLLCGPDLTDVAFIVAAMAAARRVSARSAHLAAAGSGFGVLAAALAPPRSAGSRALMMVSGAAAVSWVAGTWAAIELGHRPRVLPPDPTPWHELATRTVLRRLESRISGLTADQASFRLRAARDDDNEAGVIEPFLTELANPLNPVLAAGAGIAAVIGSTVDAALVIGLIGVNTTVGGVQRLRTERTLAAMLRRSEPEATVVRDGQLVRVNQRDLVRGDVVMLEAGDVVPADCRILEADNLEVDESNLTGESLPVSKSAEPSTEDAIADRTSMLFEDTTVASGDARAVVVATGALTETARSLAAAERGARRVGGVEQRLEELTRRIIPLAGLAAAASLTAGVIRRWPLRDVVGTGVSLAIASVPEGLPFIATAAQLASVRRLAQRHAVVRAPATIEALGRVDVLCFDKTGTLTEGHVRAAQVFDGRRTTPVDTLDDPGRLVVAAALRAVAVAEEDGEEVEGRLDLVDQAIVDLAETLGIDVDDAQPGWRAADELPFEPTRGMHLVLGRHDTGHLLAVKGAPEVVVAQSRRIRRDGELIDLDRFERAIVDETVERLAESGHRVLAIAERHLVNGHLLDDVDQELAVDLDLVGLVAFADPVRTTAAEAVDRIRRAGVETVMITGDHPATAEAVAAALGMLDPISGSEHPDTVEIDTVQDGDGIDQVDHLQRRVLTGVELERMDDAALDAVIDQVAVFARMNPSQKVRVVEALQRVGRVVAMTGDGANDAPAIRLADVGVAIGGRGTAAAQDAADLVVVDDRLETIVDAIAEGRAMWGSVRSAIGILVGGNLGEIGFTVVASLFSRRAPLNARQFLLVNLVTDLAPAIAVAVRPPADASTEVLLREGPDRSLGTALDRDLTVRAVATASGATLAWGIARMTGTAGRAGTVGLIALVGTQLGQTLVAGGGRSPTVLLTSIGSAAALVAIVQTPFVSQFFGCRPVGPVGWMTAISAATAATIGADVAGRVALPSGNE